MSDGVDICGTAQSSNEIKMQQVDRRELVHAIRIKVIGEGKCVVSVQRGILFRTSSRSVVDINDLWYCIQNKYGEKFQLEGTSDECVQIWNSLEDNWLTEFKEVSVRCNDRLKATKMTENGQFFGDEMFILFNKMKDIDSRKYSEEDLIFSRNWATWFRKRMLIQEISSISRGIFTNIHLATTQRKVVFAYRNPALLNAELSDLVDSYYHDFFIPYIPADKTKKDLN